MSFVKFIRNVYFEESLRTAAFESAYHLFFLNSFKTGDRYHIETSPLIFRANKWTGFYMVTASVMKELIYFALFF